MAREHLRAVFLTLLIGILLLAGCTKTVIKQYPPPEQPVAEPMPEPIIEQPVVEEEPVVEEPVEPPKTEVKKTIPIPKKTNTTQLVDPLKGKILLKGKVFLITKVKDGKTYGKLKSSTSFRDYYFITPQTVARNQEVEFYSDDGDNAIIIAREEEKVVDPTQVINQPNVKFGMITSHKALRGGNAKGMVRDIESFVSLPFLTKIPLEVGDKVKFQRDPNGTGAIIIEKVVYEERK